MDSKDLWQLNVGSRPPGGGGGGLRPRTPGVYTTVLRKGCHVMQRFNIVPLYLTIPGPVLFQLLCFILVFLATHNFMISARRFKFKKIK